jgi:hypothetical protein
MGFNAMINITELRKAFADKLAKTDNFDDALIKVLWLAYQAGVNDTINEVSGYTQPFNNVEWDETRIDTIGSNGNDGLHYGEQNE